MGSCSQAGKFTGPPKEEARKVTMGRKRGGREERERKNMCEKEERERKKEREQETIWIYREEPLREGQPSLWAGKFMTGYAR